MDVDFAFVGLIELAFDEGFIEGGFEGADDAGHLGGEDADGALDFADGERGGGVDEGVEGEVLGFGEFGGGGLFGGDAFAPTQDGEGEDFLGHLVEGGGEGGGFCGGIHAAGSNGCDMGIVYRGKWFGGRGGM